MPDKSPEDLQTTAYLEKKVRRLISDHAAVA